MLIPRTLPLPSNGVTGCVNDKNSMKKIETRMIYATIL